MKDIGYLPEMFSVFDDVIDDWLEEAEALHKKGVNYKKIKAYIRTLDPRWTGKMLWEFEYCLKVRKENAIIQPTKDRQRDKENVLFFQHHNILIDKRRHEVGLKIPGEDIWEGKNRTWFLPKDKRGRPKIERPLNLIKAMHLQGLSTRAIAEELRISKSTVATIIKKGIALRNE